MVPLSLKVIGDEMNFNDLKIFRTIYEVGSLNKAAQTLGYAQSNITARLKLMEQELNSTLFVRMPKGVQPTEAGNIFYKAVLNIQAELAQVSAKINQRKKMLLGSETLISEVLSHNNVNYKNFSKIVVKNQNDIVKEAASHLYDIVVTFINMDNSHIYNLNKVCLISTNYAAQHQSVFSDKSVPILINSDPECAFRKRTLKDLIDKTRVFEVDSLQAIELLVEQGKGIALLPSKVIEERHLVKMRTDDIILKYYLYQAK